MLIILWNHLRVRLVLRWTCSLDLRIFQIVVCHSNSLIIRELFFVGCSNRTSGGDWDINEGLLTVFTLVWTSTVRSLLLFWPVLYNCSCLWRFLNWFRFEGLFRWLDRYLNMAYRSSLSSMSLLRCLTLVWLCSTASRTRSQVFKFHLAHQRPNRCRQGLLLEFSSNSMRGKSWEINRPSCLLKLSKWTVMLLILVAISATKKT